MYWEQNGTQGTDSLAAIIDATNPMLTKVFKIIFIISGNEVWIEFKTYFPQHAYGG